MERPVQRRPARIRHWIQHVLSTGMPRLPSPITTSFSQFWRTVPFWQNTFSLTAKDTYELLAKYISRQNIAKRLSKGEGKCYLYKKSHNSVFLVRFPSVWLLLKMMQHENQPFWSAMLEYKKPCADWLISCEMTNRKACYIFRCDRERKRARWKVPFVHHIFSFSWFHG